jgi:hypothetical protein
LPRETAATKDHPHGKAEDHAAGKDDRCTPAAAGDPDTPVFDRAGMMARTVIEGFLEDIP